MTNTGSTLPKTGPRLCSGTHEPDSRFLGGFPQIPWKDELVPARARKTAAKRRPGPPGPADALRRSTGVLSTAAMARMDADLPWFKELGAEERSWVGLIVQAGVRAFVDWFRDGAGSLSAEGQALASSV